MAEGFKIVAYAPPGQDLPTPGESAMLAEIRRRESSGDYGAKNPDSTASGAYQFINGTWKFASGLTGVPTYATAAEAPEWIQDANAVHMLRAYGPNSTMTWAASGPYRAPSTAQASRANETAAADASPPFVIRGFTPGESLQPEAPQAATPAPAAPASPQVTSFAQQFAPTQPSVFDTTADKLERAGKTALNVLGIPTLLDLMGGASRDPARAQIAARTAETLFSPGNLWRGAQAEAARYRSELAGVNPMNLGGGDVSGYLRHVAGAVPVVGGLGQPAAEAYDRGDLPAAIGHTVGTILPIVAPELTRTAGQVAGAVADAAGGPATAIRGAVTGAVKAIPGAVKEAAEKSVYGATGGLPGMVGAGKVAFGKEIAKGAVQGAKDALAERSAAAAASPQAAAAPPVTPEPAPYTPGGPGYPIITPPPEAAPAAASTGLTSTDLARSLYGNRPLTDVEAANVQNLYSQVGAGQAPVAPTSPRVMSDAEAAQVFPDIGVTQGSPGEPPPAAQAPTRTLAEIQGEISQRLTNLQNLAKQPQTPEVVQQTSAELSALGQLKNEQPIPPGTFPATPPAASAAPEAPPAAPATPPAAEAVPEPPVNEWANAHPNLAGPEMGTFELADRRHIASQEAFGKEFSDLTDTQKRVLDDQLERDFVNERMRAKRATDPVAFVRQELAAGNHVAVSTLRRQFGMSDSAARKLLKDSAPATTSAQGQAAFEAAKASGQPAVTPAPEPATPEPPSELEQQLAASIREAQARKITPAPVVQPGQTVAEALAAQAPPGPKSLAELMAGIPERPELEKLDFAHITRTRNVERLYDTMREAGVTPEMVDAEGDAGWAAVAKKAKIGPKGKAYVPSETTKAQLRQRFAKKAQ